MKPPVVHQPVQPPLPDETADHEGKHDAVEPADSVAADDGRDVRYESTEGPAPGLVGGYGPIVETSLPDRDGAADGEREKR